MVRSYLQRLLLTAQRGKRRPPALIRGYLQRVLSKSLTRHKIAADDWSSPLIDRGQEHLPLTSLSATAQNRLPEEPLAAPGPGALRCVIATGGLKMGGLGEVVAFLATYLPLEGVQVLVADCSGDSSDVRTSTLRLELDRRGIPVLEIASTPDGCEALLDWKPDVVSSHGSPTWLLDFCSDRAIPYVETLHGMHEFLGADWSIESERARSVSAFVAVSELVRSQYLQVNPFYPPGRIHTIPNASAERTKKPVERRLARSLLGLTDEFLFVSLSRYCLQKNVVGLVSAFGNTGSTDSQPHLLVSGHVEDQFHLAQAWARRSDSRSPEHIHLRQHTTAPTALLAAADAFVLDSFFEGWPLASMEALHAGLPVIISEVGGALEQVGTDGSRGHVVPNPLGHTGLTDYETIRNATYRRQSNVGPLRDALLDTVVRRDYWRERRSHLRLEADEAFPAGRCAKAHADVLRHAASSVPGTGPV